VRQTLLPIAAAALIAGLGIASAQTSTTTTTTSTWTNDQGAMFRQYSTTEKYNSVTDPGLHPSIGSELPGSVTVYPLPSTMNVPHAEQYSYSIINNQPVVVERTTRKVVHTWSAE
jgi:hypothetical protein